MTAEAVAGDEELAVVAAPKRHHRKPPGRPRGPAANGKLATEFTAEDRAQAVNVVLERMADGQTLAETARDLGLHEATVRGWMQADDATQKRYQAQKRLLGQGLAERALTVALAADSKTFQADRLKVETLRWLASKVNAEEYGDRTVTESTGEVTLKIVVEEERVEPRQVVAGMRDTLRIGATAKVVEEAQVEDIAPVVSS